MPEKLNGTCAICGKKYSFCGTCKSIKTFKAWRTVTDTIECYKIYMIIHQYSTGLINKPKAKKELESCKIPQTLQEHIKRVIDDIMGEQNKTLEKNKEIRLKKDNVSNAQSIEKNNE